MTKINTIDDYLSILHKLPYEVQIDIDKRIGDWLAMGGTYEDHYIKQQFRFAENTIRIMENKNT